MALIDNLLKVFNYRSILKRERLVSANIVVELDRLKKRANEDIPAELNAIEATLVEDTKSKIDAMAKKVSEDIDGQCNKLKQSITEEILSEFKSLKSRLDLLEKKLGDKWPPDVCRHCGERALRLAHAIPVPDSQGYMREDWRCEKCGKYDIKAYKPDIR
jgi:hypothetical protein